MTHFSNRVALMMFVISILTSNFLFAFTFLGGHAAAAATETPSHGSGASVVPTTSLARQMPLANALNADGTLKANADASGSFDVSGYQMEMTATGAPRFVQAGCATALGSWDTQFNLPDGVNGQVRAMAVIGNDLFVGGGFQIANTVPANSIARYNLLTNTWSKLGTDGNGLDNAVNALVVNGSDLYIGGLFTQANVGGTTVTVNRVARYNTLTNTWSKLGSDGNGLNGAVEAVLVNGNDLYVGGSFTQANVGGTAVPATRIAHFNIQTNTWGKLGTGAGNGVDNDVLAMANSVTDLYVGGGFEQTNVGGTTVAANNVARFNLQTNQWSALVSGGGNGVSGQVNALLLTGSDLYTGGLLSQANVGGATVTASNIARFNLPTTTWNALGSGTGSRLSGSVNALAVIGSDLYVGGQFTQVTMGNTILAVHNIARFNTQTNTWSRLGLDGEGVSERVNKLEVIGNDLYVGGIFTSANIGGSLVAVNNIARFNPQTSQWSALGTDGNGVNGSVWALAVSGNDLYAGGNFLQANVDGTVVVATRIARFNAQTNQWSALGSGGGNGVNGTVNALVPIGNDLYVGGFFMTANVGGATVSVNNIARFNLPTNTWSKLGTGAGNGVDTTVNAMAAIGNDLYVGGAFKQANVGAAVAANYIARFDTLTSVWNKLGMGLGNGVDDRVTALRVSDNNLYVGGFFTQANVGSNLVAANRIARHNTLIGQWNNLIADGNGVNGANVQAMVFIGSDLYVGGLFNIVNVGGAGGGTPSFGIGKYTPPQLTVTQVTGSPNPSSDTQRVTFTAMVTANGSPVTEGCVNFFGDGITILATNVPVDGNGKASFTTAAPFAAGTANVIAVYSGALKLDRSVGTAMQVILHNQPPVAKCKNVIVQAGANCAANAAIDEGSFDPEGGPVTLSQNPAGPYSKGTTNVTLTVRDNVGLTSQCTSTVTVIDTTPPQISCPANLTRIAPPTCPVATSLVVTYTTPTATDNCPGVSVACNPPSGSVFALGTTTVTCTATDSANNKSSCSFTVSAFALCLQDDGNPASAVLFNPATGDYRFCCNGVVLAEGKGTPGAHGCFVAITHNVADRRVLIQADLSAKRGTASLQLPVGQLQCLVTDFNMADDNCNCP
jgi:hypothetical protein